MSDLTKKEQTKTLKEIKKQLKELGITRKLRIDPEVNYHKVSIEIADTEGEYSEDGYIINLNQFDEHCFLHGEYSNIREFEPDCELQRIVDYLKNEEEEKNYDK